MGFPIRKSSDQSSFAAPQGLSQRTTSFIASQRQGIHRMPLRHLIALMIDVRRSAAPDKDVRKTISIPNPPRTPEGAPTDRRRCLPNTSDPLEAAGAVSSLGTCSLFTMSNIRQPRTQRRIPFHADTQGPSPAPWWSQTGSNRRPHACKARALPTELWPHSREPRPVGLRFGRDGGPGTTRTSDLTLIRGAL